MGADGVHGQVAREPLFFGFEDPGEPDPLVVSAIWMAAQILEIWAAAAGLVAAVSPLTQLLDYGNKNI